MLAGHDPSTIQFRHVVDVARALVTEIYGEYGLKFEEASDELDKRLYGPNVPDQPQAPRSSRAPDDASSMAMLQAMMKDSDFGGPRG